MSDPAQALVEIKRTLERLSDDVSQGKYPSSLLKDFKLTIDQLRLTLWAILEFEEQSRKSPAGAQFGLNAKLAEFRVKRITQMLNDLRSDISHGQAALVSSDVINLSGVLQTTLQSLKSLETPAV